MADTLEFITDILEQESRVYIDLLELSNKKIDIIREGHVAELEKLTKVEQSLILKNAMLEKEREKLTTVLTTEHNLDDATISALETLAAGDLKDRITKVRSELERTIGQLKDLNKLNEQLLLNNLEYIDYFLNVYTGHNVSGNLYAKDGQAPSKKQSLNIFDKKA